MGGGNETPLHNACAHGHSECIKLLLEANANKDAMNNGGKTARMMAFENGYVDCIRLFDA
jgi:ankyrin repeat protein